MFWKNLHKPKGLPIKVPEYEPSAPTTRLSTQQMVASTCCGYLTVLCSAQTSGPANILHSYRVDDVQRKPASTVGFANLGFKSITGKNSWARNITCLNAALMQVLIRANITQTELVGHWWFWLSSAEIAHAIAKIKHCKYASCSRHRPTDRCILRILLLNMKNMLYYGHI